MGWTARAVGSATMVAAALVALGAVRQGGVPAYRVEDLRCAGFQEAVRTRIRGEIGSAAVEDKAGRDGVLVVRATPGRGELALEVWYDSLKVWRVTSTGLEKPDTDGFVGGRYRGILTAVGSWRSVAVPFVPNDVAEVADLQGVMAEFFPLLAPVELKPGREWVDSTGWKVRRRDDQREGGQIVKRYEWTGTRRAGDTTSVGDSAVVSVDQIIRETGELRWSDRLGPLGWSRHVVVNARIPARGGVKRPVTTVVEQDITVTRLLDPAACR